MKYKKSLTFAFILIFIVVAMLIIRYVIHQQKYKPIINPHPRYFMTVKGNINPSLSNHLKVNLIAIYYTSNPKCVVTDNIFADMEGAYHDRGHSITFKVKPNNHGNFSVKIPLDRYKLGYCKWRVSELDFQIKIHRHIIIETINFFTKEKNNRNFNQVVTYACSDKNCKYLSAPYLDTSKPLFDKRDYQFGLMLYKE